MAAKEDLLTFDQALADSETLLERRSILLGNGFGMAWNPSVFGYDSLFDEAELKSLSVDKVELFDVLKTRDFERVIDAAARRGSRTRPAPAGGLTAVPGGARASTTVLRDPGGQGG